MPVRTTDVQLSIGFAAGGDNLFGSKATTSGKEMCLTEIHRRLEPHIP